MTNKDKKIVSDYMGWKKAILSDGYHNMLNNRPVLFDLNDAGLLVDKLAKRSDWLSFITFADNEHFDKEISAEFSAWLFNAENFFKTFADWRSKR